jgi:hypothetical protein
MNGARLVGRGLHDTFENLIGYVIMTIAWWLCVFLVVPCPSATRALFIHADPRHGTLTDRPSWNETVSYIWDGLWRSWRLALLTLPVLLILIYNVFLYDNGDSPFGVFTPLWTVLLFFGCAITASAYSLSALDDVDAKTAVKRAAILVVSRAPQIIVLNLLLLIILTVGTLLVVPTAMFLPMTVAATFNRFVLSTRNITIPDPLAPTDERLAEGKSSRRKWWGP